MANISSEVLNYFKLDLLTARSGVSLNQLFKRRYSLYNSGQVWNDSPSFRNTYLTSITAKGKNKNFSLTPVQKTSISDNNSDKWDVTILIALLLFIDRPSTLSPTQIQELDQEDTLLKELKTIRNELAHSGKKSVNDVEFNQSWTKLAIILVELGDNDTELNKLKDNSIFESPKQPINEENVKEALHLNSLGTEAHKDGKYSKAITFFTKATVLPGVSSHDRAIYYSNMSASRLSLYEQGPSLLDMFEFIDVKDERYRALQDAKQARNLWSTWWEAHFRVGKVYASLNEHEKAINSYERAFALDLTKSEIQKELNKSRIIFNQQSRDEYVDPKMYSKTIPEVLNELQQKFGTDPEEIPKYYSLIEEIDPSRADVMKGHKYELGDADVKQDYEQAAKYFSKATSQGNAEGMYNLARLHDRGLGVKKDHYLAFKLLEQAAAQPPEHPIFEDSRNVGVAEAEHALGVRYFEGITVRKDLPVAFYWYQRATDHGSAMAAKSLGSMYLDGLAVNKDFEKAEQLFELAANRGDPIAMKTLAELQLIKDDFQMAKIWYDRACESGNVVAQRDRDKFEKTVQERQQFISQNSPTVVEIDNAVKKAISLLQIKTTSSVVSDHLYIEDYSILREYVNRDSVTAKQLCDAIDHFAQALNILLDFKTLTEEQEDIFVHVLSQCYRIEHIVVQIQGELYKMVSDVTDRVLSRCTEESNPVTSQLDEDVRLCYVTLHINSYELVDQFLEQCKQKYPKSMYFFLISGIVNGFLRRSEIGLYNINNGLLLEPNNCELLYHKAVLLRNIDQDMNEAIKSYETFLSVAPKDHRKVPEAYYEMAICYLQSFTVDIASNFPTELAELAEWTKRTMPILNQQLDKKRDVTMSSAKKLYEEGKQAEKSQLPCFLPYKSDNIAYVKLMIDYIECLPNSEPATVNTREQHLTDPHRVKVIIKHRKWESKTLQEKTNSEDTVISFICKLQVKQQTTNSLIGLKQITLKEMNSTKDKVYNGYALSVTVIEETYSWIPLIYLVIEDENFDCERMLVYDFPEKQGEYLISKTYSVGSKMHIINPYLRVGQDMKPAICVDDFSSIVMQSDSERVLDMCRYCCQPNASKVCGRCEQAHYCSKECQTIDWKSYKHKLICKEK